MLLAFINKRNKTEVARVKIEILFLTFTISLFIFRTAIPLFKYPFIILYSLCVVIFLIGYFPKIKSSLIKFIFSYFWIIILTLILFLSFIFSNKTYLIILKDIFNTLILLSIFYFFNLIVETKKQFVFWLNSFINFSIFFALIISGVNLFSLFTDSLSFIFLYSKNLGIDYNFAIVPVFLGLIGVLYKLPRLNNLYSEIALNLMCFIFTIGILISGSRRGVIILFFIMIFVVLASILSIFKRKNKLTELGNKTKYFLLLLVIFHGLLYILIFHTSGSFKNNSLKVIGIHDIPKTKNKINSKLYRYTPSLTYFELYDIIWSSFFDPVDPDYGWGTRKHKTIYPLSGKNVDIVPIDAKGYLMDSTCNSSTWNDNAYSYTKIGNESVVKGDVVYASVYCYVSEDFDGTWARLLSEGSTFGDRKINYDLNKKGSWQKLDLKVNCKEGKAPVYLYFSKYGTTDFSSLKGYVIYSYPQYKVIKGDSLQSYFSPEKIEIKNISFQNSKKKQNLFKIHSDSSQINLFKLKETNKLIYKLTEDLSLYSNSRNTKCYKSGMLYFSLPKLFSTSFNQLDTDPIRNWVANLVSEDTTYHIFAANIVVDSVSDRFIAPRTVRWQFAWQILKKEYNWKQKIFGNGFDYLNWYGYYFYNDKTKTDWPHNPFLSVLLYSGIFGLGLYLVLMYKVVAIYLKYIKEYYILFIFFGITFFFSFFSANSPFNPPVMGFFMMLPFFIDYIHKKDKSI